MTEDLHSPTTAGPEPTPVVGAADASFEQPAGSAAGGGGLPAGATGFQATGVTFPTTGCWKVEGRVGDARLAFVVSVRRR